MHSPKSGEMSGFVTLDLVCVLYDPTQPGGALWALLALSPHAAVIVATTWIVARGELEACCALAGMLISTALNTGLKHWWKEPRPLCNLTK